MIHMLIGLILIYHVTLSHEDADVRRLCTFDAFCLCGWKQDTSGATFWRLHSGKTFSENTGPSRDATTGSGFYIYLEGTLSYNVVETVWLISPMETLPFCGTLSFHWHMYGSTMGRLNVHVVKKNGVKVNIWSRNTTSWGDQWLKANIQLPPEGSVQIQFEGIRGYDFESDMALDDIDLVTNACGLSNDVTTTGLKYTKPESVTGLCSFEDFCLCGWSQDPSAPIFWRFYTGDTPTSFTGPRSDTTTGSGFYIYLEATEHKPGQAARLISPQTTQPVCGDLRFDYSMYGTGMGTINVYAIKQDNSKQALWGRSGDQGFAWLNASIQLPPEGALQIQIEGVLGADDKSDIALDDVLFVLKTCSVPPTTMQDIRVEPLPAQSCDKAGKCDAWRVEVLLGLALVIGLKTILWPSQSYTLY